MEFKWDGKDMATSVSTDDRLPDDKLPDWHVYTDEELEWWKAAQIVPYQTRGVIGRLLNLAGRVTWWLYCKVENARDWHDERSRA